MIHFAPLRFSLPRLALCLLLAIPGWVLVQAAPAAAQCGGANIQIFQTGSSDYLRCNNSLTYAAAETACTNVYPGWHLASVTNATENTFLTTNNNNSNRWIGLNDITLEGNYVWTDGSAFSYTNWDAGEPDGSAEDCIRKRSSNGQWQDRVCTEAIRYWCEGPTTCGNGMKTGTEACDDGNNTNGDGCSSTCTVEPGWYCAQQNNHNYERSICTAGCTSAGISGSNSGVSYVYCPVTATWTDAQTACRAIGTGWDLTTINSVAENTYVNTLATNTAWIGFNDIAVEGTFVWSNGTSAYTNWAAGEPNGGATDDCTIMNNNGTGTWADQLCTTATRYVCEGPNQCANSVLNAGEGCDDGNTTNGDGCDASCAVETGYSCVGSPSVCTPICTNITYAWKQYSASSWKEYMYCKGTRNWDTANTICNTFSTGWHLLSIDSAAENNFIGGLQNNNKWIGLNDQAVEGTFAWTDASPLSYTNWSGTNPNGGATQDCVRMLNMANSYRWGDRPCTDNAVFVCEGPAICSNGVVGDAEQCDDGNLTNGDGCSSNCEVENGYECTVPDFDGAPFSVCTSPMHVSIADVAFVPNGGGVTLEWDTTTEAGTIGFEVSKRTGSGKNAKWAPVHNDSLIGLQDAPQGGRYQLRIPGGVSKDTYRITEITRTGAIVAWEGVPRTDRTAGRALKLDANGFAMAQRVIPVTRPYLAPVVTPVGKGRYQLRAGKVPSGAVFAVAHDGLQSVPVADLASALGTSQENLTSALTDGKLSLTDNGVAVAWEYDAAQGAVRFVGKKSESVYSANRAIVAKLANGTAMNVLDESTASAADATNGLVVVNAEQDVFAGTVISPDPDSDYWFWAVLSAAGANKQFSTTMNISAVPTGNATLTVRLHGAWDIDATRAQNVQVLVNGHSAGTFLVDALGARSEDVVVQPGWLVAGDNTVTLKATWAGAHGGGMYVDGFALSQTQPLRTTASSLRFEANANSTAGVEVGGTTAAVYDLTTGDRIEPALTAVDGSTVRAAFDTETGHRYLVTSATAETPAVRSSYDAGLTSTAWNADYVVITPSELRDQATRLAGLRSAQGLTTLVVELNDLYDTFTAGTPSPRAMNAFLKHAASHWTHAPRYVVLLGDGSFDYRGIKGVGPGLVPPLMVTTKYGLYASDALVGDVNGDGIPEITVGRLPVRTDVDANRVIDRIEAYEAHASLDDYEDAALLVSGTDRGAKFSDDMETIQETLPASMSISAIATNPSNAAEVHDDLIYSLNKGKFWFNYVGHGGMTNLDDASIFTVDDVPSLTNAAKLPIVTGMTCNIGRFEVPGFDSLADALLLGETGGAIAVWGATGITQSKDATSVGARFGDVLVNEGAYSKTRLRLGDIVAQTRDEALTNGEIANEELGTFVLMGDPALRLPDLAALDAENLQSVDPGTGTEGVPSTGADAGSEPNITGNSGGEGGLCAVKGAGGTPSSATWMLFLGVAIMLVIRRRRPR